MSDRIIIDPKICHGKPVIRGTRVMVTNILSSLASGFTFEQILEDYPQLSKDDILAAIWFGSQLTNFESYPYEVKAS